MIEAGVRREMAFESVALICSVSGLYKALDDSRDFSDRILHDEVILFAGK